MSVAYSDKKNCNEIEIFHAMMPIYISMLYICARFY